MTEPLYRGEAICKRWGDSSSAGRTVTLQLEDGGEHPFRGYEGERFAIVVVPIGNDEKPMKKLMGAVDGGPRSDRSSSRVETMTSSADVPAAPAKPKKRWHEMPPSQRAALLVQDPEFEQFAKLHANYNSGNLGAEPTPDLWLKYECHVASKRDIVAAATSRFAKLESDFMAWRQARQHGAA